MKGKINKLALAGLAAGGLCMIGAVKVWAPVCSKLLELVSGKFVPMKCFYTGQVLIYLGALLAVTAVVALFVKKTPVAGIVAVAVGALAILAVSGTLPFGIGVCANLEMPCQLTASWGKLLGGLVAAVGVAQILTSTGADRS